MPRAATEKKAPEEKPAPISAVHWNITVDVDWQGLTMPESRAAYAELKKHFETAGKILNARIMDTDDKYVCFMAGKEGCCKAGVVRSDLPRFIDYQRTNPKTGLSEVVKICSELCSIRYQQQTIAERRERNNPGLNG